MTIFPALLWATAIATSMPHETWPPGLQSGVAISAVLGGVPPADAASVRGALNRSQGEIASSLTSIGLRPVMNHGNAVCSRSIHAVAVLRSQYYYGSPPSRNSLITEFVLHDCIGQTVVAEYDKMAVDGDVAEGALQASASRLAAKVRKTLTTIAPVQKNLVECGIAVPAGKRTAGYVMLYGVNQVGFVAPGGTAKASGLTDGDQIVEFDGRPFSALSLTPFQQLLAPVGSVAQTTTLTVKRPDGLKTIRIHNARAAEYARRYDTVCNG